MKIDREKLENLICEALIQEVATTPKPGLVDCYDNGAHSDMDIYVFERSARAITPFLAEMALTGFDTEQLSEVFAMIRKTGLEAEVAMYRATEGINTHKGAIFTLGVILAAWGWLIRRTIPEAEMILEAVRVMCGPTLIKELETIRKEAPSTKGERLYRSQGEAGIRGQCIEGFPVLREAFREYENCHLDETQRRVRSLMVSISRLNDTNVISRSSPYELGKLQRRAFMILDRWDRNWQQEVLKLNDYCIERNISPGGSADVLAAVLLIDGLLKSEGISTE